MFTGIIEAVGKIETILGSDNDLQVTIHTDQLGLDDVEVGDSIAVNGVCLTVTNLDGQSFTTDISKETLSVTTGLNYSGPVNLEKALRANDRLGGHLVSGHVDGIGVVKKFEPVNDCWLLEIEAPHAISKYIARKGSICVNGVSLTTNTIENDLFSINLIPHTVEKTTLGLLKTGSQVNLEIDLIARYVERMQQWEKESN